MTDRRKRQLTLLAGIGGFYVLLWLLWLTPVVFPLRIFVVLLHEASHALAAMATGGTVERITLNANEGGATYVRGGSAFVMLSAGYLGSLLWGLGFIEIAGASARVRRRAVAALAIFTLVLATLYVRNLFGFAFTLLFAAGLGVAWRRLGSRGHAAFLLTLGLTSASYALLDIRSDVLRRPHLPSDAAMLGDLTGLPTLFWGLLWIVLAGLACAAALRRWLRRA